MESAAAGTNWPFIRPNDPLLALSKSQRKANLFRQRHRCTLIADVKKSECGHALQIQFHFIQSASKCGESSTVHFQGAATEIRTLPSKLRVQLAFDFCFSRCKFCFRTPSMKPISSIFGKKKTKTPNLERLFSSS